MATVVGARPEFVKAAAFSRALADGSITGITETIVHTGQHYDHNMSQAFFDDLELPRPDHNLEVGSGSHARQTGEIMTRLEPALVETSPDVVAVYGDTNSTLAGALVAAKLHIPVAHIEAGLRSFNRAMPEEINRIIADRLADILLCPSATSAANLEAEGITEGVNVVGDINHDAMLWALPSEEAAGDVLERFDVAPRAYAMATVHRAENTDDPVRLADIVDGLNRIAQRLPVLLPLHPRTASRLGETSLPDNLRMLPPLGHSDTLALLANATIGLTDSGGLQKELYWLGTPCVTLRNETEWVETVATGWNRVVGTSPDRLVEAVSAMTTVDLPDRPPIYGDGNAAARIAEVLKDWRATRGRVMIGATT